MMNPATMMKIMQAKDAFTQNHPKFVKFLNVVFSAPVEEGTVIEITVKKPGEEEPLTTNFRVLASDLELIESLKDIRP